MDAKDIDFYNLKFDFTETKTMWVADYKDEKWSEGKLMPFGPFEISPGACVLNYGQGIFEGMKALRGKNGEITLFRPEENGKRINESASRMLMPHFDVNTFVIPWESFASTVTCTSFMGSNLCVIVLSNDQSESHTESALKSHRNWRLFPSSKSPDSDASKANSNGSTKSWE